MNKTDAGASLLPCPFCGGKAGFEECAQGSSVATTSCTWSVGCMNSDVDCIGYQMLASFDRKTDAANAWNTRAAPVPQGDAVGVEAWIEEQFSGYGVAVRRKHDAPIPGEPFMSMKEAKEIVRRALSLPATGAETAQEQRLAFDRATYARMAKARDDANPPVQGGEPVAWQYRQHVGGNIGWNEWQNCKAAFAKACRDNRRYDIETRPLYASSPVMEMQEALELAECIGRYMSEKDYRCRLSHKAAEFVANRTTISPSPTEGTAVAAAQENTPMTREELDREVLRDFAAAVGGSGK